MKDGKMQGLLGPYRVLDLTDERFGICGKLLGDLGAEVILIEKPGNGSGGAVGPFYHNIRDREKSLFRFAFQNSKKGITLDIEEEEGQHIFKRLVENSDCVIESFHPGYLDGIDLGYSSLSKVNPGVIYTSVTPFGSTGPYKDYKASDLTLWALSGLLFICGDPDRAPLRISVPQAYLHSGVDAATGTVMAFFHKGLTGEGQEIRISVQKSMERVAYSSHILWDANKKILNRVGGKLRLPPFGTSTPLIWQCKDGYVAYYLFGGPMGTISNPSLVTWMDEEGMAPEHMKGIDWAALDIGRTPQKEIDEKIVDPISEFFLRHTQKELWAEGIKRRVMVYPVNTANGVLQEEHLRERKFWIELDHEELGEKLRYPGAFIKTEEGLCRVRSHSPMVGEHNEEIYGSLLGLSKGKINALRHKGVI